MQRARLSEKVRVFVILFSVILSACGPAEKVVPSGESKLNTFTDHAIAGSMAFCTHHGTVREVDETPGCEFVIVLTDGMWLQPVMMDDPLFKLRDGQEVCLNFVASAPDEGCEFGVPVRVLSIREMKASVAIP
ncbi:MAG: hypothetical protein AAF206_17680 [Bacteroidota bacterium]